MTVSNIVFLMFHHIWDDNPKLGFEFGHGFETAKQYRGGLCYSLLDLFLSSSLPFGNFSIAIEHGLL